MQYHGVMSTRLLHISNNNNSYLVFVLEIMKFSKYTEEILVTLISAYQLASGESSWTVLQWRTLIQLVVRFN